MKVFNLLFIISIFHFHNQLAEAEVKLEIQLKRKAVMKIEATAEA